MVTNFDEAIINLKDGTKYEKAAAAGWLGRIGDTRAIPILADIIQNNESYYIDIVAEAIVSIGLLGWRDGIPMLELFIKNVDSWTLRAAAAQSIGYLARELKDTKILSSLVDAIRTENDDDVRTEITMSLGRIADNEIIDLLENLAINDRYWPVREAALEGLADLNSKKSMKIFIEALGDSNQFVREAAARAIDQMQDTNRES